MTSLVKDLKNQVNQQQSSNLKEEAKKIFGKDTYNQFKKPDLSNVGKINVLQDGLKNLDKTKSQLKSNLSKQLQSQNLDFNKLKKMDTSKATELLKEKGMTDAMEKFNKYKNTKNLKKVFNSGITNIIRKNVRPNYAIEISNLIFSLGNGNPFKVIALTILFIFSVMFIMVELIAFYNIGTNIISYLILNLMFLTTFPQIIIAIIELFPGDFISMTKLNELIYFMSVYLISFFLNYKLYKLFITQRCAAEKIECEYVNEIIGQPFNYAFISTTITFAIVIIIKFIVKIFQKLSIPYSIINNGASGFLNLYDYSSLFKYGLIYNLIGLIIHILILFSIKSKMSVQPISY
jgi:hypothetical protein